MSEPKQPTPIKVSNVQRAQWRQKCRKILADHISRFSVTKYENQAKFCAESKLGIVVEPSQVRLLPELRDSYAWNVRPERKHLLRKGLFRKQLSKHAVGAYMELCREVGNSFEAVRPACLTNQSCDEESQVRPRC